MPITRVVIERFAAAFVVSLIAGCADPKDAIPPAASAGGRVHPAGWASPGSPSFHGTAIRDQHWEMHSCRSCHGSRYDGGISNVSCLTCHTELGGPENCSTCHGGDNPAPPRDLSGNTARQARGVGAHQRHLLGGSLSAGMLCSQCHRTPSAVAASGHLDSTVGAEVLFDNSLALTVTNEPTTLTYDSLLPLNTPTPTYDTDAQTCATGYCHGDFKNGNPSFLPVWNDDTGASAACGTCHGDVSKPTLAERALPGGFHPNDTHCVNCHASVVDANLRIIDKFKHVDGKLDLSGEQRDF